MTKVAILPRRDHRSSSYCKIFGLSQSYCPMGKPITTAPVGPPESLSPSTRPKVRLYFRRRFQLMSTLELLTLEIVNNGWYQLGYSPVGHQSYCCACVACHLKSLAFVLLSGQNMKLSCGLLLLLLFRKSHFEPSNY